MDDDQQFCLRWNNHQSTLISVFDTLLENETLVDCTLAAEGKFLKAHKVVLSACSPYFATLLQEQYDKHPIFILKDVKYQELRAMMDYMYRGEVNISQDQLAALLKAAESLQIKGLSDNRSGGGGGGGVGMPKHDPPQQQQQHRGLGLPSGGVGVGGLGGVGGKHGAGGGYTLEQTKRARLGPASIDSQELSGSREGSSSPTSRRRRKVRRRSIDNAMSDVHHDNSNSSQIQSIATTSSLLQQQTNASLGGVGAIAAAASALAAQVPASVAAALPTTAVVGAASSIAAASTAIQSGTTQHQMSGAAAAAAAVAATTSVTKKTESVKGSSGGGGSDVMHSELLASIDEQQQQQQQQHAAGLVELKTEKLNHKQQKSVLGKDASAAGSSVTSAELVIEPKSEYDDEGNEENVEDLTLDDEDMGMEDLDHNAGTSHGNEGSSQGYAQWQHDRSQDEVFMATQEAQQRDPQDFKYDFQSSMTVGGSFTSRFPCARCGKSYLRKRHLQRHMRDECIGIPPRFTCNLCPSRFRRKYHMVRHLTSKHGIPPPVAQQATGGTTGALAAHANGSSGGGGLGGGVNNSNGYDGSGTDSPIPENLSMRKEHFELETKSAAGAGGGASGGGGAVGVGGSVGGAGGSVGSGILATDRHTPPPLPSSSTSLPTYGLTGAITAISAAAAAAVVAQTEESENLSMKPNDNIDATAAAAASAAAVVAAVVNAGATGVDVIGGGVGGGGGDIVGGGSLSAIKAEPISPGKAAAAAAMTTLMDDEWKMKLSLQLISNSLLKERLLNSMPFAYNNKN